MALYTKKSEILFNYLVLPHWENREDFGLVHLDTNETIYEGTCFECWTYLAKIQPKCRWLQKYVN